MMSLDNPKVKNLLKHCGKRENAEKPAFSPFPTMISQDSTHNFFKRRFPQGRQKW